MTPPRRCDRASADVAFAATDPPHQGQGRMGGLLRAVCRVADAARLPAYLETGGERNRAVYERFGFVCVGTYTLRVDKGDPDAEWAPYEQFFAMLRPVTVEATPCAV